jgi:small subunit ribosomal protein S2
MSLILGIFILGILAGWILEWLFVLLFIPNPKQRLEKALESSRQEIARLQSRIRELETRPAAPETVAEPVTETAPQPEAVAEPADVTEPEPEASPQPEAVAKAASEPAPIEETSTPDENLEPDDLTKLGGIGPKLAEAMQAAGITRFAQIAEMGSDEVGKRLSENGVRYAKAAAESWSEQAKLAAQGDWKGLKAYQESLKA